VLLWLGVSLSRQCEHSGLDVCFRGCSEMEKKFSVEAKSFAIVVLDGVSVLRVVEKRKKNLGEVVLSAQCSNWLASTLEVLMGIPEDQEFVKSFREDSKILIARRGGNRTGRFLGDSIWFGRLERFHYHP
jgi:hypothetical protein